MANDKDTKSSLRSQNIARNWDLLSVVSFSTAVAVGLVRTVNDIRQQFMTNYVFGGSNKGATEFADIIADAEIESAKIREDFHFDRIGPKEFNKAMHDLGDKRQEKFYKRMASKFEISTDTVFKDWTIGTWQRAKFLGRVNRVNAALGFTGTAVVALGAIAVVKHSGHVLDAINQKLGHQDDTSRSL